VFQLGVFSCAFVVGRLQCFEYWFDEALAKDEEERVHHRIVIGIGFGIWNGPASFADEKI